VLEEYTVHVLQNNAIEEYKNELREKAKELLEIKEKLEELINRQLEQEERIVNRPHQGDILREPGNYVSSVVIPPFRR
jgi:flagellar biosynthesis chaperone FliJ